MGGLQHHAPQPPVAGAAGGAAAAAADIRASMRGQRPAGGGRPTYVDTNKQMLLVLVLEGGLLLQEVGWLRAARAAGLRPAPGAPSPLHGSHQVWQLQASVQTPLPGTPAAAHRPLPAPSSPPLVWQDLFVDDCIAGQLPVLCFSALGPRGAVELHNSTLADVGCTDIRRSEGVHFLLHSGQVMGGSMQTWQLDERWARALARGASHGWHPAALPSSGSPAPCAADPGCPLVCPRLACRTLVVEDMARAPGLQPGESSLLPLAAAALWEQCGGCMCSAMQRQS